jgi:S-DNA-T family DNA segregation ATPase FtsK/SpoIIIE
MKIKFTLKRHEGDPVDLVATVDSATTVRDLALVLQGADPDNDGEPPKSDEVTLALVNRTHDLLDPRQAVVESSLTSGSTVALTQASARIGPAQGHGAAIATVESGPNRGQRFSLASGTSVIGREPDCEIRLSDPLVSRRHARINVSDVIEIIDMGSANGVIIDDQPVPRSVLRTTDMVLLGDSKLSFRIERSHHDGAHPQASTVGFVRPPRLDPAYAGASFEAPEPPQRERSQRFPIVSLLAPLLMGGVLFFLTGSVVSLVFVGLSPIMLLGTAIESRVAGRLSFKQSLELFRSDVADLVTQVQSAAQREIAGRDLETPSVHACVQAATALGPLFWTRRPGERAFGEVRLGIGELPSRNVVELPRSKLAPRALVHELAETFAPFATVRPVPVVGRFHESAIGVAGPHPRAVDLARSLVIQVLTLHSPAELVVCAFLSAGTAKAWEWLKWLPHASSPQSPLGQHLISTQPGSATLISDLEELLRQRRHGAPEGGGPIPAVLVVVEVDPLVEHSRLVEIAERGAALNVFVLWLADDLASLPAACRTFVDVGRQGVGGQIGFVHEGTEISPVELDLIQAETVESLARRLSPVVDRGARVEDESDLPRAVSLLNLTGPELATSPGAVIERWRANRSIVAGRLAPEEPDRHVGTLRAVIGQSVGEVLALDLRTDGPHALLGGTTGAGKSELLQTWILAMAAAHSPQRLTFLLVDYKGGSAFSECVGLPHTVGLVTDLSPYLVRRALTSLSAELRYREHVLAQHSAKDLMTLERQGQRDAPPSLVIIVDEFAALATEVPEFVDGVVNVAQRGRSLGLHLILATQRPAGVIKDNLRANTNLRLALRMADESDSSDVLGSPDAAFFDPDLPGRAVSKTGPRRLVPFQAGYVGGWTSDQPPPPDILVEELTLGVSRSWQMPEDVAPSVDPGDTDIQRLVACIRRASQEAGMEPPRKPWLPELKRVYDLANQGDVPTKRRDTELVFAVRDDPENQRQPTIAFFPDREGNLAVYGTGGSGKSTVLRSLAVAAGFTVRGGPCHVYGLDFGARGLAMLEPLPHVGSIIAGSDHERLTKLIGWLRGLVDERALLYSQARAGTITDYRRLTGRRDEPRVLLLVDGIVAFRQAYEPADRVKWFDMFTSIATDGRPVGVHVLLTTEQRSGMTTALASAVQRRLVLRLASAEDYAMLGVPGDVLDLSTPPGRGLLDGAEIQVAVLGGSLDVVDQSAAITGFAESMKRAGVSSAPPIKSLPESVTFADLVPTVHGLPVIGMAADSLGPASFRPTGSFIVSGPPGSGRSTTLESLLQALRVWDPKARLYYMGSRKSPLVEQFEWAEAATTPQQVMELANELLAGLPTRSDVDPPIVLLAENHMDLSGTIAEMPLQGLAKVLISDDHFVVVDGDPSTLIGSQGLGLAAKTSRAGIILQPEQADGTLFRTPFPRVDRKEFPPGRGYLVQRGQARVIQVARATEGGET